MEYDRTGVAENFRDCGHSIFSIISFASVTSSILVHPHSPSPNAMDSIIETQRQTHEGIERYEQALAEVLMQNPTAVSTPVQHKNP